MNENVTKSSFEKKALVHDIKQYNVNNMTLMLIHVFFLIANIVLRMKHMAIVNVFSILFYLFAYPFFKKSKKAIIVYSYLILAEIMSHIFFAGVILGWEAGFQLWLFSLLCTFLFPFITPDRSQHSSVRASVVISVIILGEYVAVYMVTHYMAFPFTDPVSSTLYSIMNIMNAILTIIAIAIFTFNYTRQMEYKYSQLHHMADFDQLTGLGNRYFMHDILSEYDSTNSQKEYSIAMMDIDYFKKINDTYGHDSGDLVLKEVANILTRMSNDHITAGRWGGEEFLIITDNNVKYSDFKLFVENIRKVISENIFILDSKKIQCTVSIGAYHSNNELSANEVIKKADDNLYIAKEAGRNRIVA